MAYPGLDEDGVRDVDVRRDDGCDQAAYRLLPAL
jgi:hypothetical protein